jgi:hypothetical protein
MLIVVGRSTMSRRNKNLRPMLMGVSVAQVQRMQPQRR